MSTTRKSVQLQRKPQRKVPRKRRQSKTASSHIVTDVDALDAPIWGARAIGAVIGRSERSAYHLLESGVLRGAKKIRDTWSAIPSVLREQWETGGEA